MLPNQKAASIAESAVTLNSVGLSFDWADCFVAILVIAAGTFGVLLPFSPVVSIL
jgi:hypothetical protein